MLDTIIYEGPANWNHILRRSREWLTPIGRLRGECLCWGVVSKPLQWDFDGGDYDDNYDDGDNDNGDDLDGDGDDEYNAAAADDDDEEAAADDDDDDGDGVTIMMTWVLNFQFFQTR